MSPLLSVSADSRPCPQTSDKGQVIISYLHFGEGIIIRSTGLSLRVAFEDAQTSGL